MDNIDTLTDDEVVKYLKRRIEVLTLQLAKLKKILAAFDELDDSVSEPKKSNLKIISVVTRGQGTFLKQQEKFLTEINRPVGSRELWDAHKLRNVDYHGTINTFSGQLTGSIKQGKSAIKRIMLNGVPNSLKYWYGLDTWFEGDKLLPKYQEMIDNALRE